MWRRDAIHQILKCEIVSNGLKPGVTLTEIPSAARLAAGRGAVIRPQEEGLVPRNGRLGTAATSVDLGATIGVVAPRRRIGTRASAHTIMAMDRARLCEPARRRDPRAEAAAANDPDGAIEHDTEFHQGILRWAWLRALAHTLVRHIRRSHRQRLWELRRRRPRGVALACRDILPAMWRRRDRLGLSSELGRHIDTIVDVVEQRAMS